MNTSCFINFIDLAKLFGPSLLSALVAFMLFYLTTRKDRRKDKKKNKKDVRDRIRFVNFQLHETTKLLNKQILAFDKYIMEVNKSEFILPALSKYSKTSLELLKKSLQEESSFSGFVSVIKDTNIGIEIFSKLVSKVDFLDAYLADILEYCQYQFNYVRDKQKEIQAATDNILLALNNLMLSMQKKELSVEDQRFIDSVNAMDKVLREQHEQSFETYYNYLLVPIKEIVKLFMNTNFTDIEGLTEVVKCKDLTERLYNELFGSSRLYVSTLSDDIEHLKKESAELILLFDKYKSIT